MILFLEIVGAYLVLGLLFGAWFVFGGVGRVDPVARKGGVAFRLLILPGTAILWPYLLKMCFAEAEEQA